MKSLSSVVSSNNSFSIAAAAAALICMCKQRYKFNTLNTVEPGVSETPPQTSSYTNSNKWVRRTGAYPAINPASPSRRGRPYQSRSGTMALWYKFDLTETWRQSRGVRKNQARKVWKRSNFCRNCPLTQSFTVQMLLQTKGRKKEVRAVYLPQIIYSVHEPFMAEQARARSQTRFRAWEHDVKYELLVINSNSRQASRGARGTDIARWTPNFVTRRPSKSIWRCGIINFELDTYFVRGICLVNNRLIQN